MITKNAYKVTLGAAPKVKVVAAEAVVAWKVSPTAAADIKFVTVSGTTKAAAYVYCFVSKDGTNPPKATTTTRILANTTTKAKAATNTTKAAATTTTKAAATPAATVDAWDWEKKNEAAWGTKYNA